MPRPLACLVCCALTWIALAAPALGTTFREALAVDSDTDRFPGGVDPRVVTLPHEWAASTAQSRSVWYRIVFDVAGAPDRGEPLALYADRGCSSSEVWLNGSRVHVGAGMDEPAACRQPLLVALPAPLLRAQGNAIDIRLAGYSLPAVATRERAGGLSAIEVDRYAPLEARARQRSLLAAAVPQMSGVAVALVAAMALVMAAAHRRERHAAWFGVSALAWSALLALSWWHEPPHRALETLYCALLAAAAGAAVQFLLREAGRRSRLIESALVAQCVLVPAMVWGAGEVRTFQIATGWHAIFVLEVWVALAHLAWRKRLRRAAVPLLLGVAALVGLDFVAQRRALDAAWLLAADLGLPLVFIAGGLRLLLRQGRALQSAEQSRMTLESSIRTATAEIEKNFAQLAELRVEQVTERERKRIAADLHDDLGAKLLTIVHTSESERISTLAREALEEMRLSVRGLTGKPVRLIDALGDWRAEVVSRLAQAGVEADWNAPTEDLPQTLSARAYVQTTRILREAVSNIIKHSGASHCAVRSVIAEGDFQLVVQDNGRGIPLELDGRLDRGHGMSSMKHRAKQLQGQCLVESGPGYGTVIRLTLPLEAHAANV